MVQIVQKSIIADFKNIAKIGHKNIENCGNYGSYGNDENILGKKNASLALIAIICRFSIFLFRKTIIDNSKFFE